MSKTMTRKPLEPEIISGAELAEMFRCSTRTIRERRAAGFVYRLGDGYDYRQSVLGLVDHLRIEGAKRGVGDPCEELWQSFAFVLSQRRKYLFAHEHVQAVLPTVLAMDGLPEAARVALSGLLADSPAVDADPDDEDAEG